MKLIEKKVRVESSDIVPSGAELRYKVVEFTAEDLADTANAVKRLIASKSEKLAQLAPEALEVCDTLTVEDLVNSINAVLTERASAAQRVRAGIVKGSKSTAPAKVRTEINL